MDLENDRVDLRVLSALNIKANVNNLTYIRVQLKKFQTYEKLGIGAYSMKKIIIYV